jgi:hypothetical protein
MRGQALPIEIGPEKAGIGSSIPSLPPYFYDKGGTLPAQMRCASRTVTKTKNLSLKLQVK